MDDDLQQLSREQLMTEVRRLRDGIRRHRDTSGQELCWHHPELWGLLPEKSDPLPVVPDWRAPVAAGRRHRQPAGRRRSACAGCGAWLLARARIR